MQIKSDFSDKYLACYACKQIDDDLWISNARYNGLFKYAIDRKILEFIGVFGSQPDYWLGIHHCIIKYNDELFFFPLMGDAIDIYNMKNNSFSSIKPEGWERKKTATAAVYVRGEYAYIFIKNSTYCFLLSLSEHKISGKIVMPNVQKKCLPGSKIIEGTILIDENVYFPIQGTTYIACFNLLTKCDSVFEVNHPVPFLGAISIINKKIAVSDVDNNIVIIDSEDHSTSSIRFDWDGDEKEIVDILSIRDDIVIVPAKLGRIAVYNCGNGSIDYYNNNLICRLDDTIMNWRDIGSTLLINETVLLCPVGIDSFIILDPINKRIDSFSIKTDNCQGAYWENKHCIRNERKGYLEIFLNQIRS